MNKKVKLGIFGCSRGQDFIRIVQLFDSVEITAICDGNEPRLGRAKKLCPEETLTFTDFDEFIACGLDGVILCNHFHEHVPYVIKALEAGVAVLSETTAASTMAECVELVRAVEKTGGKYMLAENYPFFSANLELKKLYDSGKLGRFIFGQGEYCHPMPPDMLDIIASTKNHWRSWVPRTYYLTHSLGPLMHITGDMPVSVNTRTVFAPELYENTGRHGVDAVSLMLCQTDSGALFQVTGTVAVPPAGEWYRISCTKGGAETFRGDEDRVRLTYNGWNVPSGEEPFIDYKPGWEFNGEQADQAGHHGGDYWVCYHFIQYITDNIKPFFDVYRAAAMSAVGIQGWRSSLNNGAEYKIPDFRLEEARKEYENDIASPFPGSKWQILPPSSRPYQPDKELPE